MITNLSIGHNGRLGNQIFQYAILKCISLKNGYEVVLPKENSEKIITGRYNPAINDLDKYKLDLFECFKITDRLEEKKDIVKHLKHRYAESFTMDYDPLLTSEYYPDSTDYAGFYQCIQYYISYEQELKKILTFKDELLSICEEYISDIKKNQDVSEIITVHVRRGDCAEDKGKHQVLLSPEYYEQIIQKLSNSRTKFLVISDDIEWCQDNIKGKDLIFCKISEKYNQFASHILDFCVLSLGDKIVMSASSYSWWAAFLSNSEYIYCPNRWFGSEYNNFHEENIRHPKWIELQYLGLP